MPRCSSPPARLSPAIDWAKTLKGQGDQVDKLVEKGKSAVRRPGNPGQDAWASSAWAPSAFWWPTPPSQLGMEVYGYDPYLSVDARLGPVQRGAPLRQPGRDLCRSAITSPLHVPLTPDTKGMFNAASPSQKMKDGVRILNFARGDAGQTPPICWRRWPAGKVAAYVADFPTEDMLGVEGVIAIPHLGASTPESEDNCAVMAADELKDYLENGNILNAVNLPSISMAREPGTRRICVIHRNVPNTIAMFAATCGDAGINIENMQSKSRGEYAYTILDVSGELSSAAVEALRGLEPIVKVRVIQ